MNEREYYQVIVHEGRKLIHYMGYAYWRDGAESSEECGIVHCRDMYIPVPYTLENYELALCSCRQYQEDVSSEEYNGIHRSYFGDGCGTFLPIEDVDGSTPCGNYHCDF